MTDDFLHEFRERPRPEFAEALRRKLASEERQTTMWRQTIVRRAAWAILVLVLMMGVGFAFSPAVRAGVQGFFGALNIGGVQLQSDPELPQMLATLQSEATGLPEESDALAAIKAKVPFGFKTPAWTPEGYTLPADGATIVYSDPASTQVMQVVLRWDRGDHTLFFFAVNPKGPERTYLVAPEATVEEVQVNGQPAALTITPLDEGGQPTDQPGYSLKWVAEGVQYALQGRAGQVTPEELIRMAESLE